MQVRVVLIEPEYSSNIGAICRAMKNFGFSELYLVNPKCEVRNIEAYKGAKHAKNILESARAVKNFQEATKNCDFVIGTTGIKLRHKGTIRSAVGLRDFAKKSNYYKNRKIALAFGREGIGLNEEEINDCDFLLHIEASPQYPILNISHAAAVIFYALSKLKGAQAEKPASRGELAALKRIFSGVSAKFERKNVRAPVAFKRIISRAQINGHEAKALLNLFRLISDTVKRRASSASALHINDV